MHECGHAGLYARIVCGKVREEADAPYPLGLLRARRERPRGCRAAEQCDEFATFQLISLHSVPASQGRRQDIELAMVSQRVYDHTPARVRAR